MASGVFLLYAHTVMPGLGALDDRTFVAAYGAMDRAIVNPWFLSSAFLGAAVTTLAAAALALRQPGGSWVVAALVLYLAALVITVVVHLPLNDALASAGDPQLIDVTAVRQAFHESRWVAWNLVRTVTSLAAFGCLCWALVRTGQPVR